MAKRLKKLETKKTGPSPKYPWDRWLNGEAWLLKRGKDYSVKDASMKHNLRHECRRRGIKITISGREDGLAIQVKKVNS